MAGMICTITGCGHSSNDARPPQCAMTDCPGRQTFAPMLSANIRAALSRCDKCDNGIQHDWNFCAWCGWQLVTDEALSSDKGTA